MARQYRFSTSAGTERVLYEEAWKNERVRNWLRCGLWLAGGAVINVSSFVAGSPFQPDSLVCLAAGVGALGVGFWLRGAFHPVAPYLLTTLDVITLVLMVNAGMPPEPEFVRIVIGQAALAFFLVVAVNMVNFSAGIAIWSTVVAFMGLTYLFVRHQVFTAYRLIDLFILVSLGVVLAFTSSRLRRVISRVKERDALARFLPGPVVDQLSRDPSALSLGGEEQEATVLFADIRDFTALSHTMKPADVVLLLNEYFAEMVDEIFKRNGILDKFIGDAIYAVFAPPLAVEDQAKRALECALGMLERLEGLNRVRLARGDPPLRIGIGIHTGKLLAGNVGTPVRMEYTHIGDVVNTASRIEGLTKELKEPLLISEATYKQTQGVVDMVARMMAPIPVKGKPEPLRVYAIDRPQVQARSAA